MSKKRDLLYEKAKQTLKNAHAPYSKFRVGAAILGEDGKIYVGCNFENSSYGATICAERGAIGAMVAAGVYNFTDVMVVTDTPNGCPPCGICRQVLAEFAKNPINTRVHIANLNGILKDFSLPELLPEAFNSSFLQNLDVEPKKNTKPGSVSVVKTRKGSR